MWRTLKTAMPREHGLWSWLLAPLLLTVGLRPSPGVLLGGFGVLLGFFACNTLRSRAPGATLLLAGLAGLLALGGLPWLSAPRGWLLAFFGLGSLGLAIARGLAGARAQRAEQATRWELAAIVGFAALSLVLGVAAGADTLELAALMFGLVSFELAGLWWVRRELARVLPGRRSWREGPAVVAVGAGLTLGLALWAGAPWIGVLPALYLLRVLATPAVVSARDARRLGLGEAAWTGALVVLLVSVRAA